jgi:hypothetical protein
MRRLRLRRRSAAVCGAALLVILVTALPARAQARRPIPTLAYYYVWFNPISWQRAKADRPLLGAYSSDEERTMTQHVRWAKQAGIDGFIVSWKSTPTLNRRLRKLVAIAEREHVRLAVIYQGLDFYRRPLPVQRVANDLVEFRRRFSGSPAFRLFSRPLVIWSGSWKFSPDAIKRVTALVRPALLVLASERKTAGYLSIADAVDGNAYYWASVDPEGTPGYARKLDEMGAAVHERGGLWIAPAAPGFDARAVGGKSVVPRRDGSTLRQEVATALASSPDALGLISWNEFSENTHIEPSREHGGRYLDAVAELEHAKGPDLRGFDSDESAATGISYALSLITGLAFFVSLGGLVLFRRRANRGY